MKIHIMIKDQWCISQVNGEAGSALLLVKFLNLGDLSETCARFDLGKNNFIDQAPVSLDRRHVEFFCDLLSFSSIHGIKTSVDEELELILSENELEFYTDLCNKFGQESKQAEYFRTTYQDNEKMLGLCAATHIARSKSNVNMVTELAEQITVCIPEYLENLNFGDENIECHFFEKECVIIFEDVLAGKKYRVTVVEEK